MWRPSLVYSYSDIHDYYQVSVPLKANSLPSSYHFSFNDSQQKICKPLALIFNLSPAERSCGPTPTRGRGAISYDNNLLRIG